MGIVKAVILGIDSSIRVVDISHHVGPQDVMAGAFILGTAFREFPFGTVFIAVVDPGVGSIRAGILAVTERYIFLAPDNGLLSMVFRHSGKVTCYSIENSQYFRRPVSDTFHARDIFAPVAANLCLGVEPHSFGPLYPDPVRLPYTEPVIRKQSIEGEVIYIDGFGSLTSNIPAVDFIRSHKIDGSGIRVRIKGVELPLLRTYSDVAEGELLALIGSAGFLEVAVNRGNAADVLNVNVGEHVIVFPIT